MTSRSDVVTGTCVICGAPRGPECEAARVRSNVRRFQDERFELWRCARCRSIHASEEVDLAHCYAGYPIFVAELNWMLYVVYASMLRRLRRAGLKPHHRVLDYGSGVGLLVRYLQKRGYANAVGYDPYAPGYDDSSLLEQRYDFIVAQDVIEHVDDPHAFLRRIEALLVPGGVVSIGTPDAERLGLGDPEDVIHELHAPYHRHILTAAALREAGERAGLRVVRHYDTMYNNTLFPTMSPRFALHYVRCHDDVWDLVAEPPRFSWKLLSPATLLFAFFGYFFDRHTDIQTIFQKPIESAAGGTALLSPTAGTS